MLHTDGTRFHGGIHPGIGIREIRTRGWRRVRGCESQVSADVYCRVRKHQTEINWVYEMFIKSYIQTESHIQCISVFQKVFLKQCDDCRQPSKRYLGKKKVLHCFVLINYFLRVIPTEWYFIWHIFWHFIWNFTWHFAPHILWHSFWHSIWHFILSDMYSDILPSIYSHMLSGIWHLFWHSLWHPAWHLFWQPIWHMFGSVCAQTEPEAL